MLAIVSRWINDSELSGMSAFVVLLPNVADAVVVREEDTFVNFCLSNVIHLD